MILNINTERTVLNPLNGTPYGYDILVGEPYNSSFYYANYPITGQELSIKYNGNPISLPDSFSSRFILEFLHNRQQFMRPDRFFDCAWFAAGINGFQEAHVTDGRVPLALNVGPEWQLTSELSNLNTHNRVNGKNWKPNIVIFQGATRQLHFGTAITTGDSDPSPLILSKMGNIGTMAISSFEQIQSVYPFTELHYLLRR